MSDDLTDDSDNMNQSTMMQSNYTFHKSMPTIKSGHTTVIATAHQTQIFEQNEPLNILTVHDIDKILDDIKQQSVVVAKPIEPIFPIYLKLNIEDPQNEEVKTEKNSDETDNINDQNESDENNSITSEQNEVNVTVSLCPKETDFKNYFRDLIDKYEQAAGKFSRAFSI